MKNLIQYTIVLTLLLVNIGFGQQNNQLLSSEIRDLLHESLSGELAKDHVIQIPRHHRIQGSRGYRDAANYVLQQLKGFGYSEKNAFIESFKSDGKVKYQTWQSPSGWDIEWGELRMIEPYERLNWPGSVAAPVMQITMAKMWMVKSYWRPDMVDLFTGWPF